MATYVVQGHSAPTSRAFVMAATGAVVYSLTSAADGTELTGSGDMLSVIAEGAGWLHISTTVATDKAAAQKTHRVLANARLDLGGVVAGQFISFLADV
jgi:hypothetical protein